MVTATPRALPEVPVQGSVYPAFAFLGWRWISRNPASAIAPVLVPFIFLYFLYLISSNSPLYPHEFPGEVVGAMLFTTQNIGNWVLGDSATWRMEANLQDLFVASPLGKIRYLFGIALSNLIPAVPALVVLGILLGLVASIPLAGWFILLGSIFVLWVLFSGIGIAISSRLRTRREIWPVGNLAFTMLGMLSPLYYPQSVLPAAWRAVTWFLPGTYAALLAKGGTGLLGPVPLGDLVEDAVLLLVCAAVGLVISMRIYRWGDQ
jgi:ABC-type multidrug transport system permease subunit